jgi:small ligand-binding sensory domain FIST
MRWASALSLRLRLDQAVDEAAGALRENLQGGEPHLLAAFPTAGHSESYAELAPRLRERFPLAQLLGCSGGGVIGGGHEAEGITALSITAAVLPGVEIHPVRIEPDPEPSLDESPSAWRKLAGVEAATRPLGFVLLMDPFSSRAETILAGLDYAYPGTPKIGGLASAAAAPGGNALYLGDDTFSNGLVGVALSGEARMDTVVAQGARPVGDMLSVTRCRNNFLLELGGRPALEVFQHAYQETDTGEEQPVAFFLGIEAEELEDDPPEFLVRNILGADRGSGAMSIASALREGQRVQFHVMTPSAAEEDLRDLLTGYREREGVDPGSGGFLFTCNGRGRNLFGRPDHDSDLFHEILQEDVALGGLFCAGEIGPIGGSTHLHGFTSSFGIVRPA